MKNAGVFVGGLTSVLTLNLIMIGVCSSAPSIPVPAPAVPPPLPAPIVRMEPAKVESQPVPWSALVWRCNGHISLDDDAGFSLPICLNRGR